MYNSNKVAERIKSAAKIKGVTIKKLLEDIGLNYNTITTMKKYMPRSDSLAKIADYLDCSVDYLLGRTEKLNLQQEKTQLIDYYNTLNSNGQERLINYALDLTKIDEYKKCDDTENVG